MAKLTLWLTALLSSFTLSLAAGATDTATFKKCVGALHAFENSIKGGQSTVDSYWVAGVRGSVLKDWILKNPQTSSATDNKLVVHVGNTKDIAFCATLGVPPEEIELFLLAFHGYLPSDPFEGLAECTAAFLAAGSETEMMVGSKRSYALSYYIGERIGATVTQLNHFYGPKKHTIQDVQARAAQIVSSLSAMSPNNRASVAMSYRAKCAWYNIPVEGVLQGAGVPIR